MLKKTENFVKNSGLFLNMAKWCFWVCFFEVLMLLWFVFGVFGIVPEVLKMLVFFSLFFGLLWGGLFFFIYGLEGLGVFVFLVFVFVFLCCFCFCFVCFVFVLLLVFFGVGSCFALVFVFFYSCCFFVFVFLFFWRV